jgi:hypothetical protein
LRFCAALCANAISFSITNDDLINARINICAATATFA